jgi:hypothetical protein
MPSVKIHMQVAADRSSAKLIITRERPKVQAITEIELVSREIDDLISVLIGIRRNMLPAPGPPAEPPTKAH